MAYTSTNQRQLKMELSEPLVPAASEDKGLWADITKSKDFDEFWRLKRSYTRGEWCLLYFSVLTNVVLLVLISIVLGNNPSLLTEQNDVDQRFNNLFNCLDNAAHIHCSDNGH